MAASLLGAGGFAIYGPAPAGLFLGALLSNERPLSHMKHKNTHGPSWGRAAMCDKETDLLWIRITVINHYTRITVRGGSG